MLDTLVGPLLRDTLGLQAASVRPLAGGEVGRVFRADAGGASYAVKFVNAQTEPAFADESVGDRVYGSRWSNLRPAHALIEASGLPLPALHAAGTLPDQGVHYAILDFLDGDADDGSPAWSACVGEALGRLHAITRAYQGWVAMNRPYPEPWSSAFGSSFRQWSERSAPYLPPSVREDLRRCCERRLAALAEPDAFVLSHTDGFQGVLRHDGAWSLLGVIDIEDHQFTDQRFVLAGFELAQAFWGRGLDPAFWDAYAAHQPVDPEYRELRPLFWAHYLLVWTWVFRDRPDLRDPTVERLGRVVAPG
ncbi:MAG TPA: hypothetical protein VKT30_01400 [Caulobacteraceae bacterium]|nr:hypothetical protein [Caulobacteraceae bacterium]